MPPQPLFVLDEPHYHRLRIGETHRFRGLALGIGSIRVERAGKKVLEAPVDGPFPAIAPLVGEERAARCRFDFEMKVEPGEPYRLMDGQQTLFTYDVPWAAQNAQRLKKISDCVNNTPAPPPDVIAVTQGVSDVDAYRDSIVSAAIGIETILGDAINDIHDVLDIGCGTGRLLTAWHCSRSMRWMAGVDINADLIRWNDDHLRDVAEWSVCHVAPPLEFPSASFDFIQLTSVFTHLTLGVQRQWVDEIRRLLRTGGRAIITLHGETYANILLDDAHRDQFHREGYVEIAAGDEGANSFSTFHSEAFARELFAPFRTMRVFPRGVLPGRFATISASQDIWLVGS